MNASTQTPMMQQYLAIKAEYPDVYLFYRMGDFYELFFEDATEVAELLHLTLTSRSKTDPNPIPMAGVPVHTIDNYLAKLIKMGKSVAICDQVGSPNDQKGPMQRKVSRIVTPGTLTEDSLLDEQQDNLLAAIHGLGPYGLAYCDLSSGTFCVLEVKDQQALNNEFARLSPKEILLADNSQRPNWLKDHPHLRLRPPWDFNLDTARKTLSEQCKTKDLRGFGCEEMPLAIGAAGALLQYLKYTQKTALPHIQSIQTLTISDTLTLDATTRANLELTQNLRGGREHSLISVIDHTNTPMGSRLLNRWIHRPIRSLAHKQERLDAISSCIQHQPEVIQNLLKGLGDIERITSRLALRNIKPRDFIQLRSALRKLPDIMTACQQLTMPIWDQLSRDLDGFAPLYQELCQAIIDNPPVTIRDGGVIAEGHEEELDNLRSLSQNAGQFLIDLETQEREQTGINTLKVGYNKVHGYFIEISKGQSTNPPEHYIRRQTLKNAERYITPELKGFEEKALSAKTQALALEKQCYEALIDFGVQFLQPLQTMSQALATIDVLSNLAERAMALNWHRPELCETPGIVIEQGRHPVVEDLLSEPFVPNNTILSPQQSLALITGPNMGGKSTYMRQVAIITLMAHIGSYVPASKAIIGPIDRIFTRIGASDEIASGRSTFMVEMTETATILNQATDKSLVLMDEIGRGTSTFDGMALAWACAQQLATENRSLTLFATHYFELTNLSNRYDNIINLHLSAKTDGENIVFLHTVQPGHTNQSHGIQVAKLAGLPPQVIEQARKKINLLEKQSLISPAIKDDLLTQKSPKMPALHPVLEALANLDTNQLSPIEALNHLHQLKAQYQKKSEEVT